jgi:ABC-2 type transport system permease protein
MIFLIRWLSRRRRARQAAQPTRPRPARTVRRPVGDGPVRLVLHQARYDLLAFLRNTQARFFTLALPVIFMVIFVGVFGNDVIGAHHVKAATYYVPGLSALAIIASSFVNLVIAVTTQRETGILKRRRATPVPAWVLIAGRTLTAMAISLVVMAVLLVVGRVAFGVHLPTTAIPGVLLTAILGSVTFCILGYAISTLISDADAAQPAVQAITLPLYFISGVFIPNVQLPRWLGRIGEVFPVQHLADGLHHAFNPAVHGSGIVASDLAVLALWTAAGLIFALRRFTWSPTAVAA